MVLYIQIKQIRAMRENQKENYTMKKEIEYRRPSMLIKRICRDGEKVRPLSKYPTSHNCAIWEHKMTFDTMKYHNLVSYGVIPVAYFEDENTRYIKITVEPLDLTQTTRRHIYAFVREYAPPKRAEQIIKAMREQFAGAPNGANVAGHPAYVAKFDLNIAPED